jgi:drug/metabolite transporter (DMT)-like permease
LTTAGRATFIGFGAIVLWSCLALLTAASGRVPPFQLAAMTFAIGGGCGLIVGFRRGDFTALRQPWPVWALGVGGLFGYHALYFAALRLAPPAEAGLIAYLWPLLIVLFAGLLPGENLSRRHLAGAFLGLAGVVVLSLARRPASANLPIAGETWVGYALALACAFVWSSYSILSRRFPNVPSRAVAGFCAVTAGLSLVCHLLFETTRWPNGASQWLATAGLGLGPVGLAFYLWDYGVKRGDIRLLGVMSYAAPVLSTLLLVAAGFAEPTAGLGIACGLIVGGALLASVGAR